MRQRQPTSSIVLSIDDPVSYRLEFRDGNRTAMLASPALNRKMHPKGVAVRFESASPTADGKSVRLDAFESRSLLAYLEGQDALRPLLEHALTQCREEWNGQSQEKSDAVWTQTKVEAVLFTRRLVATPQQVRHIKAVHGPAAEQILREEFDRVETDSSFAVLLRPRWMQHLLTVQFRDGVVVKRSVEG